LFYEYCDFFRIISCIISSEYDKSNKVMHNSTIILIWFFYYIVFSDEITFHDNDSNTITIKSQNSYLDLEPTWLSLVEVKYDMKL
jgi:hypothetical protein